MAKFETAGNGSALGVGMSERGPTGTTRSYGGCGYNYQYLGNTPQPDGVAPFHAADTAILAPARTVVLGDIKGTP